MTAFRLETRGWRARGLIERESLDGGPVERVETQSCRHCQSVLVVLERDLVRMPQAKKAVGFCSNCQSVLCYTCSIRLMQAPSARDACMPFMEVIEASYRRIAFRQALGL